MQAQELLQKENKPKVWSFGVAKAIMLAVAIVLITPLPAAVCWESCSAVYGNAFQVVRMADLAALLVFPQLLGYIIFFTAIIVILGSIARRRFMGKSRTAFIIMIVIMWIAVAGAGRALYLTTSQGIAERVRQQKLSEATELLKPLVTKQSALLFAKQNTPPTTLSRETLCGGATRGTFMSNPSSVNYGYNSYPNEFTQFRKQGNIQGDITVTFDPEMYAQIMNFYWDYFCEYQLEYIDQLPGEVRAPNSDRSIDCVGLYSLDDKQKNKLPNSTICFKEDSIQYTYPGSNRLGEDIWDSLLKAFRGGKPYLEKRGTATVK